MSIASLVQRLQDRPAIPPQAAPEAGRSVRTVALGANAIFQAVRTREPAPMLAIRPVFAPVAPFAPGTVEVRSAGGESAPAGLSDEAQHEDDAERSCTNCRHRLKPGTCAEPIAAGLLTEEQGYGIVWPAQGYGAACAAFALVKGLS